MQLEETDILNMQTICRLTLVVARAICPEFSAEC